MSEKERLVIATVLFAIAVLVGIDLKTDSLEGTASWHLIAEATVCVLALLATFYLMRSAIILRGQLQRERNDFSTFRNDAEVWRGQARTYLLGLSQSIDNQLTLWHLTPAEKEVAFLLLKGMSMKEVAQVRNTSEKTARVQSIAVYAKANVAGRSELSAYFLEDLLVPNDSEKPQNKLA